MKYTIILLSIIGAIGLTKSGQAYNHRLIYVETPAGQVLEMPLYQEAAINETIPGQDSIHLNVFEAEQNIQVTTNHSNLSRILLCITKTEDTEPFPYELN